MKFCQSVLVFVNIVVLATCSPQLANDYVNDPDYGHIFDHDIFVTMETLNLQEKMEQYCYSKRLIANGSINTTVYQINVNPFGIDGSKVNCEVTIDQKRESIYELIRREVLKELVEEKNSNETAGCILNRYRSHNYADKVMKIANLARIYITNEQKSEERSGFIAMMNSIAHEKKECLLEDVEEEVYEEYDDQAFKMNLTIPIESVEIPVQLPTLQSEVKQKLQIIESTTEIDESATIFQIIDSGVGNIHCTRNTFATILFSFAILNSLISI